MNWIKNNPFVGALAGITLVLCAVLFFLGSKWGGNYDDAKVAFDESLQAVQKAENLPLYPKADLRDGKRKALTEYSQSIDELRNLFDDYRQPNLVNVSPQDFTASLKQANKEVTNAFEDAGTSVPDGFLMGFQRYGNEFATEKATGILNYELQGIKHALLKLAEAKPSALINVYRDPIPEETGEAVVIGPDQVSRNFGFEIAFKGSEASARSFMNSLGDTKPYYYIVRCIKAVNEHPGPPQISDARFEKPAPEESAPSASDNPFGGAFVLPGADIAEPEATAPPADGAEAAAEPGAAAEEVVVEEIEEVEDSSDSSRILMPVLGSEEIIVFIRFDLTMFLDAKELPKP